MNGCLWFLVAVGILAVAVLVSVRRTTTEIAPALVEELLAAVAPFVKPAFVPVVQAGESGEPESKFGGRPWLPAGWEWPECPGCRKPMQFFVQLDTRSLPPDAGVAGDGLIQLFMCTTTRGAGEVCHDTWEHDAPAEVVRLIPTDGGGLAEPDETRADFPPRRVIAWQRIEDYPDHGDWETIGLELRDELDEMAYEVDASDGAPETRQSDKLGGWPYWVQNPEWGTCRECGAPMRMVLQLDSEDNVPYMFGDAGVGHVSQCETHPHVLVWGWACH